ncbi:hypothetical protein [Stakelama marina]|uniref:Uncharacterized protein n=1 Tax=Stakelama marina TaxID=2826939 RepID=A0A8T4IL36_9SPHN|nr:hypothetical protein [Stakelama marina]MBR0553069.1 hypothetical protein [Stakelama marina]
MMIDQALKAALKDTPKGENFDSQLQLNKKFQNRMERAGVVTRKQSFSIPLMERIVGSSDRR